MSEVELIGIIYTQLLEEFGFGYCEKDLWMITENLAERVANKQSNLNENQQIVLEWLKANVDQDNASPMSSIFYLGSLWESRKFNIQEDIAIDNAYSEMTYKQQAQVLQVFSQWVLEQEEE